jgi:hypothetical protein
MRYKGRDHAATSVTVSGISRKVSIKPCCRGLIQVGVDMAHSKKNKSSESVLVAGLRAAAEASDSLSRVLSVGFVFEEF